MPNRYVREGIIDSERINKLSWQAEVFYRRLLNRVDDFGRFTANPELLRASLFPLQLYKVQAADIGKMLLECEQSDLVSTWKGEDGKPYLALHKWEKGRAKFSKYPHPPTHVNKRLQMFADVPDPGTDSDPVTDPVGETRAREEIRKTAVPPKPAPSAPPPQPSEKDELTNKPTLLQAIAYFRKHAVSFREEEVRECYRTFEITAQAGFWFWGKQRVGDWRHAMEQRMRDNREKRGGKKPPTDAGSALRREIERCAKL